MQTLTLVSYGVDDNNVISEFACDFVVTTAGDGIWGCEAGRKVHCTAINIVTTISDGESYNMVNVVHDSDWDIYTDTAFEAAISDAVGFDVTFTEQGMQEEGMASLENVN